MARTRDPEAHAARRDAFVDAGSLLIQSKGYEQLSVQEILGSVGASKGAFYHYFDSKADLLEAVVLQMTEAATTSLLPVVDDPDLTALEKLNGIFTGIARWKGDRTELLMAVMDGWLTDDNAIVREKFRQSVALRLTPVLARIVAQGQTEGTFRTGSPEDIASVLVTLIQGANEVAIELYYARKAKAITFDAVEQRLRAYGDAYERILGLPAGSFPAPDRATLLQWFG
jgi:AcrR family transcriptional regulator